MRLATTVFTTIAALAMTACVVVPVPGTSPQTTGGPLQVSGPTLRSALAGRAFLSLTTGATMNLWSDGTYTVEQGGNQFFGTWRTVEERSQMCFTGAVADYARGNCIPIRWDGDFLTLFDASQTRAMETFQPL